MKTSTLCTTCGALVLLAAGLTGVVDQDPARESDRSWSPIAIFSDSLAAWMTPRETPIAKPHPAAAARDLRPLVWHPQPPVAPRAVLVDAPWCEGESMMHIDAEVVRSTLERIEAECEKARSAVPRSADETCRALVRQRA